MLGCTDYSMNVEFGISWLQLESAHLNMPKVLYSSGGNSSILPSVNQLYGILTAHNVGAISSIEAYLHLMQHECEAEPHLSDLSLYLFVPRQRHPCHQYVIIS